MTKFMINIFYGENSITSSNVDFEFIMKKYNEWSQQMGERIIYSHKLKDETGRKLTYFNGKILDGPFTESKESIGGFYIIEAASYNEAVEMSKDCPSLLYSGGYLEVREVEF